MSDALGDLASLMSTAERIVAFTGAGVSTESGIPDFRSPGGVWDRYAPIDFREFVRSEEARRETWRRGLHTYPVVAAARPNPAHLALVAIERSGRLRAVVTQNIDGLHQMSGLDPSRIIELHGNAHRVRCLDCGADYERAAVHERVLGGEGAPNCARCRGTLKPATISFGERLSPETIRRAEAEARGCDLMLVIGSSLVVYPAASIPVIAVDAGAKLAIVNGTETPLDSIATIVMRGKAGEILPRVVGAPAAT